MSEPTATTSEQPVTGLRRILRSIGPGLVTACVVIGPGSIISSTKVGATHGYATNWVVVGAVLCMMIYMTLGMKLGVVTRESAGTLMTRKAGRWLAALVGLGVFFIATAYQFGNNVGVHAAFDAYRPAVEAQFGPMLGVGTIQTFFKWGLVPLLNLAALSFLFAFKDLYKALELAMSCFVGLMLLAFAVNLFFAKPDVGELLSGFIPRATNADGQSLLTLELLALVGTTFVIPAAFYQSYLVRFRGWGPAEMKNGLIDARVGAGLMALITLMIISTAAALFHGTLTGDEIKSMNAVDVANQLEPAFGETGRMLFCVGLFSAAYSSFLVNSMIGGFILADGLGLGDTPNDRWPRLFTAAVLLVGMVVGLYVIQTGQNPVRAIVAAQAVTVLAAPLIGGTLWWLTSRRDVMGEYRNSLMMNIAAAIGFALLLGMAYRLAAVEIPKNFKSLTAAPATVAPAAEAAEDE